MAKSKSNGAAALKEYDPCKGRPYNRYNIFYILERERFLQSFPAYKSEQHTQTATDDNFSVNDIVTGYESLGVLPPLPPRYRKLELSHDWYMPGKRKLSKRDHKKSHGMASFQEIARFVADGWKSIDDATLEYCTDIAKMLKLRHQELKRVGGLKFFSGASKNSSCDASSLKSVLGHVDDDSLGPQKKKARRVSKTTEQCLAALSMASVSMSEVDIPLSSPEVRHSPNTKQGSRFSKSISSGRRSHIPYAMGTHGQAIVAICGMVSPSDSEITIHSMVDISDQDIMAMWFKYE